MRLKKVVPRFLIVQRVKQHNLRLVFIKINSKTQIIEMLTASSENISPNKENKKTVGVKKYLENMLMKINESCNVNEISKY